MAKFSYEPLRSNRSIRLIRFLPGPKPRCQMICVEVEKAPPYVALSYTWGSKALDREIEVDRCEIDITINLAEAIEAIYSFTRERHIMFWADSICINQEDLHERGKQVQIMNTIYRSAEIVAIWLGPAKDESGLAFDQIEKWKAMVDEMNIECGGFDLTALRSFFAENTSSSRPDGSQQRGMEALHMLCRRRWWTRAWIVQEVTIVSDSRLFVFCGTRCVGWSSIREALAIDDYATHFQNAKRTGGLDEGIAATLSRFRTLRQFGIYFELLEVLLQLRAYECEDPRDKVYAALGMAMDVTENDIIPDYTKSVKAVYTDIVSFFLAKSDNHSLDILGMAISRPPGSEFRYPHRATLPSWVPDWTFRTTRLPFEKDLERNKYEASEVLYKACGPLTGNISIDGDYLHLQGSEVDKITRLWRPCDKSLATGGLKVEQSWTPKNPTERYFTGETIMEAFNHTIVADVCMNPSSNAVINSRGFASNWELVEKNRNIMTASEGTLQDTMMIAIKRVNFRRRLFETSRGFIGIGPEAAQLGDQIAVLLGGQVLYVLRTHDVHPDHHYFIGECYVHGMMDGEAVLENEYLCRDFILE